MTGPDTTQLDGVEVCMLVSNDIVHDARVLKEARSLADAGARVTINGIRGSRTVQANAAGRVCTRLLEGFPPSEHPVRVFRIAQNLLRERAWYRYLGNEAAALRAHVYHAHDLDMVPAAIRAARRVGAKLVYDAHELYSEQTPGTSWRRRRWRRFEPRALREADLVIAANADRARIMFEEYGAREMPLVIQNVPARRDHAPEPPAKARALRTEFGVEYLIMYQGGLSAGRGIEAVIEGMRLLPRAFGLALMSAGRPAATIAALLEDPEIACRVRVWPGVDPSEIPEWAAVADAGVVTYMPDCRNNLYCAPNKLYDYAAAGVPAIAADLPPLRAVVEDTGAGVLFQPGDAGSFARAARELLADSSRLDAAKRAARRSHLLAPWEDESARLVEAYVRMLRSGEQR